MFWRVDAINARAKDELKLQASLHGVEYKEPHDHKVTKSQDELIKKAQKARMLDGKRQNSS